MQRCRGPGKTEPLPGLTSEFFLGQHPPFPPPSFLSLLGQKGPSSCPQRTLPCPSQASSGICVHHLVSPSYRQIPHLLLFFLFTTSDFSRLLHPPNPFPQNGPLPLTPTHSLNDRQNPLFTPWTSPTSENLESASCHECTLGQFSGVNISNGHTLFGEGPILFVCRFV